MFVQCLLFLSIFGSLDADYYRMPLRPKPCMLPHLDHGRVRIRRSTVIKFICLQRYELVGNMYATCKDGQWDTPTPVCVRSGCTVPNIENGITLPSKNYAWVMYFCLPGYKLVGSSAIYCDGRRWNASAPTCVDSTIQNSLSCDFETSLCGWAQDELHDFDWKRLNNKTPSSFLSTGPSYDHTYGPHGSGYYMYIETTSRLENDTARFISPVYERNLAENGCFSFFYHMYGRTCGGLRVYQKPDNLPLEVLVQSSDDMKKEYILFEKWGNLGDFWYGSVSTLRQFDDNFQIIIEGIRGSSFTSDIAIDDVAILQGDNCTAAMNAASTPPPNFMPDSCVDRCRTLDSADMTPGCGCSGACLVHGNCCPDFFDVCVFVTDSTNSDDSSEDDNVPVTQKLVATTPETTSTSTTTTTTSTTTTSTTTTTTLRPTTTSTTTTTPRPTTTSTTTTTTTQRPTTTTPRPTTTSTTTMTTLRPTTTSTTTTTTTQRLTTTTPANTTTMEVPTTTVRKVTTKPTTDLPYGISRTIENHNIYHELIEKKRKEHTIETRKLEYTHDKDADQKSSNGWKVVLSVLGVLLCVVAVVAVKLGRSARGRVALARLRSRATNDPEVRFLSADTDY